MKSFKEFLERYTKPLPKTEEIPACRIVQRGKESDNKYWTFHSGIKIDEWPELSQIGREAAFIKTRNTLACSIIANKEEKAEFKRRDKYFPHHTIRKWYNSPPGTLVMVNLDKDMFPELDKAWYELKLTNENVSGPVREWEILGASKGPRVTQTDNGPEAESGPRKPLAGTQKGAYGATGNEGDK